MFLQTGRGISSWSLLPSQTDLSSYSRTELHFSQTTCLFTLQFAPNILYNTEQCSGISSWSLLPSQTDLSSYSRTELHFSQTTCLFTLQFAPNILYNTEQCSYTSPSWSVGSITFCVAAFPGRWNFGIVGSAIFSFEPTFLRLFSCR